MRWPKNAWGVVTRDCASAAGDRSAVPSRAAATAAVRATGVRRDRKSRDMADRGKAGGATNAGSIARPSVYVGAAFSAGCRAPPLSWKHDLGLKLSPSMKLAQYLARLGYGTRRQVEHLLWKKGASRAN